MDTMDGMGMLHISAIAVTRNALFISLIFHWPATLLVISFRRSLAGDTGDTMTWTSLGSASWEGNYGWCIVYTETSTPNLYLESTFHPARSGHSSVVLQDKSILVLGGVLFTGGTDHKSDVWMSSNSGQTWIMVTAEAPWKGKVLSVPSWNKRWKTELDVWIT